MKECHDFCLKCYSYYEGIKCHCQNKGLKMELTKTEGLKEIKNAYWSDEDIQTLKETVCKGATDSEFKIFVSVCKKTGLDPFARQIYAIKRWDRKTNKENITYQTSIDGYRLIAERTGLYEGQDGPYWCGDDGIWKDVWLDRKPPRAAKVSIKKKGCTLLTTSIALWDEYVQKASSGQPTSMWLKMPTLMLAKCAEALALRRSFPQELSGLYTQEEMSQADNEHENIPVPKETPKTIVLEKTSNIYEEIVGTVKSLTNNYIDKEMLESIKKEFSLNEKTKELPLEDQEKILNELRDRVIAKKVS